MFWTFTCFDVITCNHMMFNFDRQICKWIFIKICQTVQPNLQSIRHANAIGKKKPIAQITADVHPDDDKCAIWTLFGRNAWHLIESHYAQSAFQLYFSAATHKSIGVSGMSKIRTYFCFFERAWSKCWIFYLWNSVASKYFDRDAKSPFSLVYSYLSMVEDDLDLDIISVLPI